MDAKKARELTDSSQAAFNEALKKAYKEVKERAEMGYGDAWIDFPKCRDHKEKFLNEFKVQGYKIHCIQTGKINIEW